MILFLKIVSRILNLIPDSILNLISRALAWFFYEVIRFRRKIIEENLALAFGSEKKSDELSKIAAANYLHYAKVIFEILRSFTWTKNQYLSKTVLKGKENLEPLMNSKRGGVFLGNHLGNWEFAISTVAVHGVPVDVVVKKSKSSLGQKFLDCYRNRFGIGIFFETRSVKEIFSSINSGRFTGFVLDQFMGPPIGVPVNFFGKQAGTAAGLALFCEKRDLPIFPAYNYRDSEGKMVTVIEPQVEYGLLAEDRDTRIYQRTQTYNDMMERIIRKHPEQWLWLHRRWKEFRGESRWVKKNIQTTVLLIIFVVLAGCVSQPSTPTGIALPPDPQIPAPTIQAPLVQEQEATTQLKKKTKEVFKEKPSGKRSSEVVQIPDSEKQPHFHTIPSDQIPFEVGERIEMDLRWLAIPAGKAVLEVKEGPVVSGRPTFQLWGNVLSSKIVDAIYHVDNTVESFID